MATTLAELAINSQDNGVIVACTVFTFFLLFSEGDD